MEFIKMSDQELKNEFDKLLAAALIRLPDGEAFVDQAVADLKVACRVVRGEATTGEVYRVH